jgi:hypothetical protein
VVCPQVCVRKLLADGETRVAYGELADEVALARELIAARAEGGDGAGNSKTHGKRLKTKEIRLR